MHVMLFLVIFFGGRWMVVLDDEAGAKGMFDTVAACEQVKLAAVDKVQADIQGKPILLGTAFCFDSSPKAQSE